MHPEFVSYKINNDSIEFVVVKEGHKKYSDPSLLDNSTHDPDTAKTLLLVKYDLDKGEARIEEQAQIDLK